MTSIQFAEYAAKQFYGILFPTEEMNGTEFANLIRKHFKYRGADYGSLKIYLCAKAAEWHIVKIKRTGSKSCTYELKQKTIENETNCNQCVR